MLFYNNFQAPNQKNNSFVVFRNLMKMKMFECLLHQLLNTNLGKTPKIMVDKWLDYWKLKIGYMVTSFSF